jgi:hypothetical protein
MTARTFALIVGIAFTAAGILGFVPALVSPPPAGAPDTAVHMAHGYLLGLFPVNALHNVVHLAIGLWGLAAWRGMGSPVTYARSLAIFYGALAVMGLFPTFNTVFGLIPIHGHDVWLHAATALAAAWFGFFSPAGERSTERRHMAMDRRTAALPVSQERRMSIGDRRRTYGGSPIGAA